MIRPRIIWCAVHSNYPSSFANRIFATWYKGCSQNFKSWKKAIRTIDSKCKIVACNIWPVNN